MHFTLLVHPTRSNYNLVYIFSRTFIDFSWEFFPTFTKSKCLYSIFSSFFRISVNSSFTQISSRRRSFKFHGPIFENLSKTKREIIFSSLLVIQSSAFCFQFVHAFVCCRKRLNIYREFFYLYKLICFTKLEEKYHSLIICIVYTFNSPFFFIINWLSKKYADTKTRYNYC